MNIAIWNAHSSYQTFLMIPVITQGKLGAAQVQVGLEDEYSKGRDAQERARAIYESLR